MDSKLSYQMSSMVYLIIIVFCGSFMFVMCVMGLSGLFWGGQWLDVVIGKNDV